MRLREVPALAIDTWFRPVSARPLAGLRVGLPLLLLFHLVWLSSDILSLHGSRGIIPWELTDLLRDPWVPGLPTLAKALLPLGISAHTAITFCSRAMPEACSRSLWDFTPGSRRFWRGAFTSAS